MQGQLRCLYFNLHCTLNYTYVFAICIYILDSIRISIVVFQISESSSAEKHNVKISSFSYTANVNRKTVDSSGI